MLAIAARAVPGRTIGAITAAAALIGGCAVVLPSAVQSLVPLSFALLAAAAAFVLDEPAAAVVDVTPTGPRIRTAIRSAALLLPLGAGAGLMAAVALRAPALSWSAVGLALAGNVLLGFAIACVARHRVAEPGALAASAAAFLLIVPALLPPLAGHVNTFPATGPDQPGLSSDAYWWFGCGVCVAAITASMAWESATGPLTGGRRRLFPGAGTGRSG